MAALGNTGGSGPVTTNTNTIGIENYTPKDWISPEISSGPPLPVDQWPDKPLLLCVHNHHRKYVHTNHDKNIAIPINQVFDLETDSFKGQGIVRIADTPNCDKKYFKGRRRKSDCTTQGVFKKRIRFDKVFTGQVFDKPFRNVPSPYLVSTGFKILTALAPSLKADADSDQPYLMSPWPSACQTFNICKIGEEVPLPAEPTEDISILDPKFKGMSFSQRKSLFHDSEELQKYYFEPGYVYTMSFYSHMFSPATYSLHMLRMKWGIESYIPAPMQINAIILTDNKIVKSFSSENLIDDDDDTIQDSSKLLDEIAKNNTMQADSAANSERSDNSDDNIVDMDAEKLVATLSNHNSLNNKLNDDTTNNNVIAADDITQDIDSDIASGGRRRNSAVNTDTVDPNAKPDQTMATDKKTDLTTTDIDETKEITDTDEKTSDTQNILDYEMIYSFNIWHTRLVDEFYGTTYDAANQESRSSFSLFGSKKK